MLRALGDETCAMLTEEIPLGRLGTPEDIAGAVAFWRAMTPPISPGKCFPSTAGW